MAARDASKCVQQLWKYRLAHLLTKVFPRIYCLILIKPSIMLGPYEMSVHMKSFSDWIKYGCQGCGKVRRPAMEIQWVPVICKSHLSAKKLQISGDCYYQDQLIDDQIYKRTSTSLYRDMLNG